jgi:hypothetical protein
METNGYDRELLAQRGHTLATLVAPFRYPGHTTMIAAYVGRWPRAGASWSPPHSRPAMRLDAWSVWPTGPPAAIHRA